MSFRTSDSSHEQPAKGAWRQPTTWLQTLFSGTPPPRDAWEARRREARRARRHAAATKFPIPKLAIPKRRRRPKHRRKPSWMLRWTLRVPILNAEGRITSYESGDTVVVHAQKDSRGNVQIIGRESA